MMVYSRPLVVCMVMAPVDVATVGGESRRAVVATARLVVGAVPAVAGDRARAAVAAAPAAALAVGGALAVGADRGRARGGAALEACAGLAAPRDRLADHDEG